MTKCQSIMSMRVTITGVLSMVPARNAADTQGLTNEHLLTSLNGRFIPFDMHDTIFWENYAPQRGASV